MKKAMDLDLLRSKLADDDPDDPELTWRTYRAGDENELLKRLDEARVKTANYHQIALVDRNEDWIPKMAKIHARPGQHLFAVGVGHFYGEDGVLALLRRAGFSVERVAD